MVDIDFTQTIYPFIESKLHRKLSEEENKRFMFLTSGMRKEWFFSKLEKCATIEEAEQLFSTCHLSVSSPPKISFRDKIIKFIKELL